jgi:hypothetical protein
MPTNPNLSSCVLDISQSLTNLQSLRMTHNYKLEEFPTDSLNRLVELDFIDLSQNALTTYDTTSWRFCVQVNYKHKHQVGDIFVCSCKFIEPKSSKQFKNLFNNTN